MNSFVRVYFLINHSIYQMYLPCVFIKGTGFETHQSLYIFLQDYRYELIREQSLETLIESETRQSFGLLIIRR